jgi:hypothetical protein
MTRTLRALSLIFACGALPPTEARCDDVKEIFRSQLIDNRALQNANEIISSFERNQNYKPKEFEWVIRVPAKSQRVVTQGAIVNVTAVDHPLSGNRSDKNFDIESKIIERPPTYTYSLAQIDSKTLNPILGIPPFALTGHVRLNACHFDFAADASCFPSIKITNSSNVGTAALFHVSQADYGTREVPVGASLIIDRSAGDFDITLLQMGGNKIPSLSLILQFNEGPDTSVSPGLTWSERLGTYQKLRELWVEFDNATGAGEGIRAKTAATAIRVISARAVVAKYPDVVKELLRSRAADIAKANEEVMALRKVAIANGISTPEDAQLAVARLDKLLAAPDISQRDTIIVLRNELERAASAAKERNEAMNLLKEHLISAVDAQVADYQMLVVEYAQYVPNDELLNTLPENTRVAIMRRVSPKDVIITDSFLDGRGGPIRAAFGLPSTEE